MQNPSKRIHILDADPARARVLSGVLSDVLGDLAELVTSSGDDRDIVRIVEDDRLPVLIFASCALVCEGRLMERFQARGWSPTIFALADEPTLEQVMTCYDRGVAEVFGWPVQPAILRAKALRMIRDGLISRQELEMLPELTMKEYRIIRALGTAPDGRLSRAGLVRQVWPDLTISPKTIDVHIFNLRRKLRRHGFDILSQLDDGRFFSLRRLPAAADVDAKGPLTRGEQAP